jgi:hypothetical protein
MNLVLSVQNPTVDTLEGLKVGLDLFNDGERAYQLPGPSDLTATLTFEVYRQDGALLRRMNGLTRQQMMSSARVDPTPTLEDLPPGGRWRWELNLASYHYPLPAGAFEMEAVYDYDEAGVHVRSNRIPIHVAAVALSEIAFLREAPVLDGVTLLLKGESNGAPTTVLRHYNAQRPLAAWYSERLAGDNGSASPGMIAWNGGVRPFFAAARFFTTESFEPTFRKWVISSDGSRLVAQRFIWGRPDPLSISTLLPTDRTLLPSACYDEEDRLMVFFQKTAGTIEAYDLTSEGLTLRFEHNVPATSVPPAIRADCDFIHIVTPWRGVLYDRLLLTGALEERVQAFRTRMRSYRCDIDPAKRVARVLFHDGPHGRALEMVVVGPKPSRIDRLSIDNLPLEEELREMSFDRDPGGRFHLLVSTSRRKLYYFRDGRGPTLVASAQDRFFPIVHAPGDVYLGCHQAEFGYRYLHFRQAVHGSRIATFDGMR